MTNTGLFNTGSLATLALANTTARYAPLGTGHGTALGDVLMAFHGHFTLYNVDDCLLWQYIPLNNIAVRTDLKLSSRFSVMYCPKMKRNTRRQRSIAVQQFSDIYIYINVLYKYI